jgi:hypothetical protein
MTLTQETQCITSLNDHLEKRGKLTEFDYEYLKGNEEFWDVKGAAFNVVYEWCKNHGYGRYGGPTESGLAAMKRYEEDVYTWRTPT